MRHLLRMILSDRTNRGVLASLSVGADADGLVHEAIAARQRAETAANAFFDDLAAWRAHATNSSGRMAEPGVVDNPLTPAMKALSSSLKVLRTRVSEESEEMELGSLAARAAEIG